MNVNLDSDSFIRTYRYDSDEYSGDPYGAYAVLRSCPLSKSEVYGGYWIFARYEDVDFACRHPEAFSSFPNVIPNPVGGSGLGATGPVIPLEIDPPQHASYRQILAPLFGPSQAKEIEPWMRRRSAELTEAIVVKGWCEFMTEFATPLPTETWCTLMGFPVEDGWKALSWARDVIFGDPAQPDGGQAVRQAAGQQIYLYLAAALETRRAGTRDDVMSRLVTATYQDEQGTRALTDYEILNICFLLLFAGLDTTKNVLGNAIGFFAENPGHRRQIVDRLDDAAFLTVVVEELLRYESPVSPGRTMTHDLEYRGTRLRTGDRVLLLTGSAGRDPEQFHRPDEVDFGRGVSRHLAFGAGPHRCLGSHLARLELRIALEEIHRRMPDYHVSDGEPIVRHAAQVRGVDRLPLTIGC